MHARVRVRAHSRACMYMSVAVAMSVSLRDRVHVRVSMRFTRVPVRHRIKAQRPRAQQVNTRKSITRHIQFRPCQLTCLRLCQCVLLACLCETKSERKGPACTQQVHTASTHSKYTQQVHTHEKHTHEKHTPNPI